MPKSNNIYGLIGLDCLHGDEDTLCEPCIPNPLHDLGFLSGPYPNEFRLYDSALSSYKSDDLPAALRHANQLIHHIKSFESAKSAFPLLEESHATGVLETTYRLRLYIHKKQGSNRRAMVDYRLGRGLSASSSGFFLEREGYCVLVWVLMLQRLLVWMKAAAIFAARPDQPEATRRLLAATNGVTLYRTFRKWSPLLVLGINESAFFISMLALLIPVIGFIELPQDDAPVPPGDLTAFLMSFVPVGLACAKVLAGVGFVFLFRWLFCRYANRLSCLSPLVELIEENALPTLLELSHRNYKRFATLCSIFVLIIQWLVTGVQFPRSIPVVAQYLDRLSRWYAKMVGLKNPAFAANFARSGRKLVNRIDVSTEFATAVRSRCVSFSPSFATSGPVRS